MWYLQKHNDDKRIYLKPCEEIVIGRKKGQIFIPDDESLSKVHASIYVQPRSDIKFNESVSTCIVRDQGSKYGTYIIKENQNIEVTKDGYELSNQDVIRFGLQNSYFTVTYVPLIIVISSLNDEDKSTLQHLMDHLDGLISSEWTNNCTHLTVSKATLTEKVTWALISAIPIVTVAFWTEVHRAITNNQELPRPDRFVPQISESLIDKGKLLLHPDTRRKTLFEHLIFVHFSINQYKIYGKMIHLAGGKSVLYTKKPFTSRELCFPNVIVLQYPGDEATQFTQHIIPQYNLISKTLQEHGRKMIAESEIPLAILHCSVEKYCNPKFKFSNFLKRSEPKVETSKVIVIDTQDVVPSTSNADTPKFKNVVRIIPETNDSFSSQDLSNLTSSRPSSIGLICSTPIQVNNKPKSISNSNVSATKSVEQNAKAEQFKENAICIPETCDSSVSNVSMNSQSSIQDSIMLLNDRKNENIKSSTAGNNKPQIKEIINVSKEDDMFARIQSNMSSVNEHSIEVVSEETDTSPKTKSDPIHLNMNKVNERLNEINILENTNTSPETDTGPTQQITNRVSVLQESDALSKTNNIPIRKTPIKNIKESIKENVIIASSSDDESVGDMNDECGLKRRRLISDTDGDEPVTLKYKKCTEEQNNPSKRKLPYVSATVSSVPEVSSTSSLECENSSSTNVDRYHKMTINFKKFKKAPVIIPKERIGQDKMYVWYKNIS